MTDDDSFFTRPDDTPAQMTPEEAAVIAAIVVTADGDCTACGADLLTQLQAAFPAHDWAAIAPGSWEHYTTETGEAIIRDC